MAKLQLKKKGVSSRVAYPRETTSAVLSIYVIIVLFFIYLVLKIHRPKVCQSIYKYFINAFSRSMKASRWLYFWSISSPEENNFETKGKIVVHILKKMMMTDNHPLSFVLWRSFSISSTDSKVKNTWIGNTFCISEASRGGGGGVACGFYSRKVMLMLYGKACPRGSALNQLLPKYCPSPSVQTRQVHPFLLSKKINQSHASSFQFLIGLAFTAPISANRLNWKC